MCWRPHILLSFFVDSMCITSFLTLRKNTEHYFFQMPRFCLIIKHFSSMVLILRNNMYSYKGRLLAWYTANSRRVVGKNVQATILKGNMGYEQYTVPDTVAVESTFVAFLYHSQTYVHAILSNFFEEQWTQNHPQYLSGLSRALLLTIFLKIAVYK